MSSPVVRSVQVGELRATFVPDGLIRARARGLFPEVPDANWAPHQEYLDAEGCLTAGHGGLLVERGDRALLIDAGYGPGTAQLPADSPVFVAMGGGALPAALRDLGRDPGGIEAVAVTHLHVEHIGWACHLRPDGRSLFGDAEILISGAEWAARHPAPGVTGAMLDALAPRVRTVADGEEIFPGVRAVALPGHTPGHTAYELSSAGARLLAFGDAMHCAAQVAQPGWTAVREPDPARSVRSRQWVLDQLAREDTVGFGIHFAGAVFGRVRSGAGGQVWEPLP